ncbi:glutaredoxin-C9-like, partial [Trifolium medium]|nr:glutaredoxin-C9-like [Trifolium medium]
MEQPPPPSPPPFKLNMTPCEAVQHLVSSNAVVIFSMTDCCMSTVAKRLLISLGVGLTVVELDRQADGPAIRAFLYQHAAGNEQLLPAIFIGGKVVYRPSWLITSMELLFLSLRKL